MKIEINFTNTTDFVAWWGAIIATLVFIWDIYKWKSTGSKVTLRTQLNMKSINIPSREGKTWIFITAQNNGDRASTITVVGLKHYKNAIMKIMRKASNSFVVPGVEATSNQSIPFILNPGSIWQGLVLQTEEVETYAKDGILICELYCSHIKKPVESRVIFP